MEHEKLSKDIFIKHVIQKSSYDYMVKLSGQNVDEFKKLSLEQVENLISNKYDLMTDEDWKEFWLESMEQDNKNLKVQMNFFKKE